MRSRAASAAREELFETVSRSEIEPSSRARDLYLLRQLVCDGVIAALLRAGWSDDISLLEKPCLVLRAGS